MVSLAPREFPAPFAVDIGEPAGDDQRHRPDRDAAEQYWGWFPEKISSLSEEELRSVMTAVMNHTAVLLPAGPQPVMTGSEWGYPELEHDTPSCMKLLLEGIAWSLSGFFGGRQPGAEAAPAATSP